VRPRRSSFAVVGLPAVSFVNTLTGEPQVFQPLEKNKVRMYVCGITPYDECHLGHARCTVFFDLARRVLTYIGYEVTYIQNFTDVDDKIICRAQEKKESCETLANRYIEDYYIRMDALNVLRANAYPRVTENIPDIVQFIQGLIQKGVAYPLDGDVYYSVRKFPGYGKLSKRSIDELISGARVNVDERKSDPLDFALWKKSKTGEPGWTSPWGEGRPGWHIECSVMSIKHLGETFDIHGGGQDLIFPHHENEIAQSEAFTSKPFANYWLHNGFVTVNREKMSKSLGNFFTLREILSQFKAPVVRLFLLSCHYKSPLDFCDDLLKQSGSAYNNLIETIGRVLYLLDGEISDGKILPDWEEKFLSPLCNDFNSEMALAVLFDLRKEIVEKMSVKNKDFLWLKNAYKTLMIFSNQILGIELKSRFEDKKEIEFAKKKIEERENFRKAKNWKEADRVRQELVERGCTPEDTPFGTIATATSLKLL